MGSEMCIRDRLENGRPVAAGDVLEVTGRYLTTLREEPDPNGAAGNGRAAAGLPRILAAAVHRLGTAEEAREIATGDSIEVQVDWENPAGAAGNLNLGIGFVREDRIVCVGLGTHYDGERLTGAAGRTVLRLPDFPLLAGRYSVAVWLLDHEGTHRYDEYLCPTPVLVKTTNEQMGVFAPRHEWVRATPGDPSTRDTP